MKTWPFFRRRIGDSRYYARERGGARAARLIAGAGGRDNLELSKGSQARSLTIKELAVVSKAGEVCHFEAETLSWPARRVVRLWTGDSSMSFRMARRSS